MATLRALITADTAAGGVFRPTSSGVPSGFNENLSFYPLYNAENVETVNAVVVRRGLEGTREVRGDGVTFNRVEGKSVRRTAKIYVPVDLDVQVVQPNVNPDAFKDDDGVIWIVKRIDGEYSIYVSGSPVGLKRLHCVHRDDYTVRSDTRSG